MVPNRLPYHQLLLESILLEWETKKHLIGKPVSIYFGGGTPALFPNIQIILQNLSWDPSCEITIEANPEEATLETLQFFRSLGINRLSLGVQSLDDRSLQTLERTHSAQKAKEAIRNGHLAGFSNISIDLMYDLPGQTEESFRYSLEQLPDLPIQHVSLYNLTIEPHTPFHKRKVKLPDGELSYRLLSLALQKLEHYGFERYEISAFAKPGFTSCHNLGYWTFRPFLGLGPSAFSYWDQTRYRNIANLHRYARSLKEGTSPIDFQEKLPYPDQLKEQLAIQLRLKSGAPLSPDHTPETLKNLQSLETQGLISITSDKAFLTERGMLFYDTVATILI